MDAALFFLGVGVCALALRVGELVLAWQERALRIRVARRRAELASGEDCSS